MHQIHKLSPIHGTKNGRQQLKYLMVKYIMLAKQYAIAKEVKSNPAVIKCVALKKTIVKKRFKIQGGSQEMAVMVG